MEGWSRGSRRMKRRRNGGIRWAIGWRGSTGTGAAGGGVEAGDSGGFRCLKNPHPQRSSSSSLRHSSTRFFHSPAVLALAVEADVRAIAARAQESSRRPATRPSRLISTHTHATTSSALHPQLSSFRRTRGVNTRATAPVSELVSE